MTLKETVKQITPPILFRTLKQILSRDHFEYSGNFSSWREASVHAGSYDNKEIFEKVKNARLKVLKSETLYERDGIIFNKPQYFWPLLSCLLISALPKKELNILDYGGSLGTTYFQNKKILEGVKLRWNVIEQKHFVEFGQKDIKDQNLFFYENLNECLAATRPNVFLISSALQYLEKPHDLLQKIADNNFEYIIMDRTTVLEHAPDRITVQNVPKRNFPTNFPAWFFNEKNLLSHFDKNYELIFDFPSIGDPLTLDDSMGRNKGYFLRKKS